uniref:Uncharacterized protein n=1 Tax=Anguilla anguilla TaxID=7936 RepID=A0A0E9RXI7_ANGAN
MSCRLHSGRYWAFWGLWSNTRKCTSATPKPFVQRLCVCVYIPNYPYKNYISY